jgi:hypothetical protein
VAEIKSFEKKTNVGDRTDYYKEIKTHKNIYIYKKNCRHYIIIIIYI